MSIAIQCPKCGQRYLLKDELAGKSVACRCGHTMQVAAASPGMIDPALGAGFASGSLPQPPFSAGPYTGLPPGMQSPFAAPGASKPGGRASNSVLVWTLCVGGGVVVLLIVGMVWMAISRRPSSPASNSEPAAVASAPDNSPPPPPPPGSSQTPVAQPTETPTNTAKPPTAASLPAVPSPGTTTSPSVPSVPSSPAPGPTSTAPPVQTSAPMPSPADKKAAIPAVKTADPPKLAHVVSLVIRLRERQGRNDVGVGEVHGFVVELGAPRPVVVLAWRG